MYTGYKYRIFPTPEQEKKIELAFEACRFVWNWSLKKKEDEYRTTKHSMSTKELYQLVKESLMIKHRWLGEAVGEDSLYATLKYLEKSYRTYFASYRDPRKLPKFKSRYGCQTCTFLQGYGIDFKNKTLNINGIGKIPIQIHRSFSGKFVNLVVKKSKVGDFFACFCINESKEIPKCDDVDKETAIGIDLGLHSFLVVSNGWVFENKEFMHSSQQKLSRIKAKLDRMEVNSSNYRKLHLKYLRLWEKISNQRKDYIDKITYQLTHDERIKTICVEHLDVRGMMEKNRHMQYAIEDASFYHFRRVLKEKCRRNGINYFEVDQFEPTSKRCNHCGAINEKLKLGQRIWRCEECKSVNDRDYNAACNIRDAGIRNII